MKRKHVEASTVFVSKDLKDLKPKVVETTHQVQETKTIDSLEKTESSNIQQINNAVGESLTESGENQKKKRIRHRSQMDPELLKNEQETSTTTLAHDAKLTKDEREKLKRRTRREKAKEKKMDCFLCRQKGHSIANCPRNTSKSTDDIELAEMGSICYNCGSLEHTLAKCDQRKDPKNPLPFSSCFICKQKGHLAGQCPENEKGVYPNGGCCKFCGSVRHLAGDCKPLQQKEGTIMLGTMDLNQGGDDDDVFLSIHKIQQQKPSQPIKAVPVSQTGSQSTKKPTIKKKVVSF